VVTDDVQLTGATNVTATPSAASSASRARCTADSSTTLLHDQPVAPGPFGSIPSQFAEVASETSNPSVEANVETSSPSVEANVETSSPSVETVEEIGTTIESDESSNSIYQDLTVYWDKGPTCTIISPHPRTKHFHCKVCDLSHTSLIHFAHSETQEPSWGS
jgi:hypothetical protein